MPRRIDGETLGPPVRAKKLRVIQLGSYPTSNRGARTNLLTIHQRLLERGHESAIVDLTPYHHVKRPGVFYPQSLFELARLLLEIPADVVHLHIGSTLSVSKLALAALVNSLPGAKAVCTLHLGGRFYPKKRLRGWRWGASGMILRRFNFLIAINPEIASFFKRVGVPARRIQWITPFPRLRVAESLTLAKEMEDFCRRHAPLIASVGAFEPGADLTIQFDMLSRVRDRYPSAGLMAMGEGSLHLECRYRRALHPDGKHIYLTGTLPEATTCELIRRANVLVRAEGDDGGFFSMNEAMESGTPMVFINSADSAVADTAGSEIIRGLQIARPQYEETHGALMDGVDDMIRLYKQIAVTRPTERFLPAAYEWPSIG